jgi:Transglutaminase-like superfamily
LRTAPSKLSEARYRTIREDDIIESLLIAAQPFELAGSKRSAAVSHTAEALNRWVKAGLGFQLSDHGERLFDPVEVINQMKWMGLSGSDGFWSEDFVRTGRMFTRALTGSDDTGAMPVSLAPARFSLTLLRSFDLSRTANRGKVRLRIPLPLGSTASDIEANPILPEQKTVSISRSDGRLEFQVDATESSFVAIGAEVRFTTTGYSKDAENEQLDPAKAELYLRPSEGLIKITPRIQAISQSFGGKDQTWDVVLKCWDYVIDELSCGMVHYDQVDAEAPGDWVLDNGWYDCQLGSSLFVSMCRSRGIPARLMSGQMLYQLAPGFHYWAEVWNAEHGWLPFDFLSWDLSEGGRDQTWRERFVGKIDYRMVTQCLPLAFTGPMSVRFPQAWHLVNAPTPQGMKIKFCALDGTLVYSDQVSVRRLQI